MNTHTSPTSYQANKLIRTRKLNKHAQVNHVGLGICDSSRMNYINTCNSNCAALSYVTGAKKHAPVNHLGLGICAWTKVFTVCTLRIAKTASPRCDSSWTEVSGLRKRKAGTDTQSTYMAAASAASE